MSKEAVALASKLGDFFRIYLSKQKCYSENTITSYNMLLTCSSIS